MSQATSANAVSTHYLRFPYLFDEGRARAFPCDAQGRVDVESMSPTLRQNFDLTQNLVGRDYGSPTVVPATH